MSKKVKTENMVDHFFIPEYSRDGIDHDSYYPIRYVSKLSDSGVKSVDKNTVMNYENFTQGKYPLNFVGKFLSEANLNILMGIVFVISLICFFVPNEDPAALVFAILTAAVFYVVFGVIGQFNMINGFHRKVTDHFAKVYVCLNKESAKQVKYSNDDYVYFEWNTKAKNLFVLVDSEILVLLNDYAVKYNDYMNRLEYVDVDAVNRAEKIYEKVSKIARIQTAEREVDNHHNAKVREEMREYIKESYSIYDDIRNEIILDLETEMDYFDNYSLDQSKDRIKEILG